MSNHHPPVRSRSKRLLALATAFLVAAGGLLVVPTAASAAEGDVTNATLDWGFKETWRGYIGESNTVVNAPASTSPAPYRWGTGGTGHFDATAGIGSFASQGSVVWNSTHGFSVTLSNLAVSLDLTAGTGAIYADYIASDTTTGSGAHLADFSTSGAVVSGGAVSLTAAATTAAAGAVTVFGSNYSVGETLDPVSFSFNYEEAAPPAAVTSTTLDADATAIEEGTTVNLTATVTPAAAGTVEFFSGATSLGAAVPVVSGVASLPVGALTVATHDISAVFTSSDPAFLGSTSNVVQVVVTAPSSAAATGTTVDAPVPAAPVRLGEAVTLTATVENDDDPSVTPVGSVEFFSVADGTTSRVPLGSVAVDAAGVATHSTTALTAGGHSFTAVFTPSSPSAFRSSEGVRTGNYGVVDTSAPTPYAPGALAETSSGATASWDWSAYASGWVKTTTGNASVNGQTFELTGGEVLADAGGAVVSFEATLTNTAYGSVVMSITNPALHLNTDGTGVWVANVNGGAERIVVGTFSGVDAKVAEDAVRTVNFDYADTTALGTWYAGRTNAWPNAFILQMPGNVQSFYYQTTNSSVQADKPASPLTVEFDWPKVAEASLSVSPAGSAKLGSDVTLTATVVPPAAEGSVQFYETSVVTGVESPIGAPVVTTTGVARLTTNTLSAGGHTFRAEFTSSNGFTTSEAMTTANYGVVDTAQTQLCAPLTGASETLTGVTAEWDWSAYSSGWAKTGTGNVTVDGQTFALSNGVATVSENCASIAFTGTLSVLAYGVSGVTLVNPVLVIDSAGNGSWVASVASLSDGVETPAGAPTEIASIRGADFPDFSQNTVSAEVELAYANTTAAGTWYVHQGTPRTDSWSNAFVLQVPSDIRSFFYQTTASAAQANKPPAPIQLEWQLAAPSGMVNGQGSDARVLQGQTITFEASPFREGDVVSIVVNSDPVVLPSVTVGFNGVASQSWAVPASFATGAHTVTFSTGSGANLRSLSIPFTVEAAGSNSGGSTPDVCIARVVTGGGMTWEFKQSFKNYIVGPVAGGTFSGGGFTATGGAVNVDAGGIGRVNFQGSISASGHSGTLDLQINNPSVQITGPNTGVLFGTLTQSGSGGYIAIANLGFSSVSASTGGLTVTGSAATLTGAAAAAFGGFYSAGTALDPVSFSVSLGGEVACDATTDPVELAKTGGDSDALLPLVTTGALMLLLGFGLLRMRKQRVA